MKPGRLFNALLAPTLFLLAGCVSMPQAKTRPATESRPVAAKTIEQTLICTGLLDQKFQGWGKHPVQPATVLVVIPQDPSMIKVALRHDDITLTFNGKAQDELSNPSLICSRDRFSAGTCKVEQDQIRLVISFSVVGVGSTTFALDKKSGKISYSGGGMDGGWDFEGICRAK